jgi:hypothetical protein
VEIRVATDEDWPKAFDHPDDGLVALPAMCRRR